MDGMVTEAKVDTHLAGGSSWAMLLKECGFRFFEMCSTYSTIDYTYSTKMAIP